MSSSTDQTTPTFHWSGADIAAADAAEQAITAYLTRYASKAAQLLSRNDLADLAASAVRAARAVYDERAGGEIDANGPVTRAVLAEVAGERRAQDQQWGEQNHPMADPVILARLQQGAAPDDVARRLAEEYEVPAGYRAKFICENEEPTTWAGIIVEELAESLEASVAGWPAQRAELVQLAAVAVGAVESGDRAQARAAAEGEQR